MCPVFSSKATRYRQKHGRKQSFFKSRYFIGRIINGQTIITNPFSGDGFFRPSDFYFSAIIGFIPLRRTRKVLLLLGNNISYLYKVLESGGLVIGISEQCCGMKGSHHFNTVFFIYFTVLHRNLKGRINKALSGNSSETYNDLRAYYPDLFS